MSNERNNHSQNANRAGIILIGVFVLVVAIIVGSTPNIGDSVSLALLVTETPLPPTSTPIPPTPTSTLTPTLEPTETPMPTETPTPEPTVPEAPETSNGDTDATVTNTGDYDPALVERGEQLFTACAACHGPDGRGVPNLGKDLVDSEFVHSQTDSELIQFIITGRPIWDPLNTTGIDMPPKGGNPALTSEDIEAIVAYIRQLGAPASESTAPEAPETSNDDTGTTVTANVDEYDPALVERGEQLFTACAACHGPDGRGVPNLGKDLVDSEFVHSQTDSELIQFIITGRPIWDPLNTTGIDMPPKGGNPALTSEDIEAIVAYIRQLGETSQ